MKSQRKKAVYLIKCGEYTKIGYGTDPRVRESMLDIGNPYETDLLYALKVENPTETERKLHNLFQDKKIKGEWFRLEGIDIWDAILLIVGS